MDGHVNVTAVARLKWLVAKGRFTELGANCGNKGLKEMLPVIRYAVA